MKPPSRQIFFRNCSNFCGDILVSFIGYSQLKSSISLSNQIVENYLEKKSLKTKIKISNGILNDKAGYISVYILSFIISELYVA